MASRAATLTWVQFLIQLKGNTSGAHLDFVKKLQDIGHHPADTLEESDYILVFCPIASRVGTDVSEALSDITGGKPIILVLMYPTFRGDYAVPDTRGLVDNPNVQLTTSCLFNHGRLLKCRTNDIGWSEVQNFFGVFHQKRNSICNNPKMVFLSLTALMVGTSVFLLYKKNKLSIKYMRRVSVPLICTSLREWCYNCRKRMNMKFLDRFC